MSYEATVHDGQHRQTDSRKASSKHSMLVACETITLVTVSSRVILSNLSWDGDVPVAKSRD